MNKQKNEVKKWAVMLAVFACIIILVTKRNEILLLKHIKEIGNSLRGTEYCLKEVYYEEAFQDPWELYVVEIIGESNNSIFDVSGASGTNTAEIENVVKQICADTQDNSLFEKNVDAYSVKKYISKTGKHSLFVFYIETNLYYCIWI